MAAADSTFPCAAPSGGYWISVLVKQGVTIMLIVRAEYHDTVGILLEKAGKLSGKTVSYIQASKVEGFSSYQQVPINAPVSVLENFECKNTYAYSWKSIP